MVLLSHKIQGGLTWRPHLLSSHSLAWSSSCLPEEPKNIQATTDPVFSFTCFTPSLWSQCQLWPIIRGESHAAHTLSILYQILWTGSTAEETFCATMLLIFCQVGPGLYEWGPAAGGQTVRHSESPCWKGFVVWGLCLVADTDLWHKETIYCSYRGHKNSCNRKTTVWLVFIGPLPGSAQFWQSFSVDYFQAWQWCQTRVRECMVVTPGDKANPLEYPRCEICFMVSPQGHIEWFYI